MAGFAPPESVDTAAVEMAGFARDTRRRPRPGTTIPTATVISFNAGNTRANNAIMQLGPGGTITVHDDQTTGTVHFILDVNGFFK